MANEQDTTSRIADECPGVREHSGLADEVEAVLVERGIVLDACCRDLERAEPFGQALALGCDRRAGVVLYRHP
jgi:hypothetical protein